MLSMPKVVLFLHDLVQISLSSTHDVGIRRISALQTVETMQTMQANSSCTLREMRTRTDRGRGKELASPAPT